MNKLKSAKFAFLIVIAATVLSACSPKASSADSHAVAASEPPFQNEEPDRYQTYILQTTPSETVKFFVARDGDNWRIDSAYGTPVQATSLHTDKEYMIAPVAKAFAEYESVHGYDERPNMVHEITYGLINGRENAVYEKVGQGSRVVQFKYVDSKGKEAIVTYDESMSFPLKKEIFGTKDGAKTLEASVTLEGFTTNVDRANFELPKDLKKISPQEMKLILMGK
jgi:hypothetical protein